ncbi:hypothetical protein Nocox_40035 [Nonomuraea coxensis DSM 45129]|uniref:Uncharacterized protein n=1 Tax=Nonomuraea coxensis DSM 45129 TaxID=1122611 RepID=A0ABX8UCP7_9ACTN|nr:hypothetical protein Nocox_40035 [Nonomuraea coxensis DSM 45129]
MRQERRNLPFFVVCWCWVLPDLIELRSGMADVIFVILTVAIFAVLGVVVKAVERL